MNEKQKLAVVRPDEIAVMRPRAGAVHVTERYNADELARDGVVLCGEFVLASDYDALYSTAIFNRKRYEEAESRIHELEAALHEIRDADCRGEVCKGIACVALNVAYPTQDRGGEHG